MRTRDLRAGVNLAGLAQGINFQLRSQLSQEGSSDNTRKRSFFEESIPLSLPLEETRPEIGTSQY